MLSMPAKMFQREIQSDWALEHTQYLAQDVFRTMDQVSRGGRYTKFHVMIEIQGVAINQERISTLRK